MDIQQIEKITLNIANMIFMEEVSERELYFCRDNVQITTFMQHHLRKMVIAFNGSFVGGDHQDIETVTVNNFADWRQHFKAAHFHRTRLGRWLLRKYPIRYTQSKLATKVITRVCPHIKVPPGDVVHIDFCRTKDGPYTPPATGGTP
jgi:hypothetical protein